MKIKLIKQKFNRKIKRVVLPLIKIRKILVKMKNQQVNYLCPKKKNNQTFKKNRIIKYPRNATISFFFQEFPQDLLL